MTSQARSSRTLKKAVVLGDTSGANHHGCELVMENLFRGLAGHGIEISQCHSGKNWSAIPAICHALQSADLLVINGEGTIHHDRPMGDELLRAAEFAHEHGVPAYLINCTWHSNGRSLAERAAVFRRVYVRESVSAAELAAAGIATTVTPDLTLATEWTGVDAVRSGCLVSDSTMPAVTSKLYRLIPQLAEARFASIRSTRWNRGGTWRRAKRWTQWAAARALGQFGLCPASYISLAFADRDARTYLSRMASAHVMLTGRFHAACFAILTATPVIAVRSNTSKIEGLLHDAGLNANRIIDLNEMTTIRLREIIAAAALSPGEEANRAAYLQDARERIRNMFSLIAAEIRPCVLESAA